MSNDWNSGDLLNWAVDIFNDELEDLKTRGELRKKVLEDIPRYQERLGILIMRSHDASPETLRNVQDALYNMVTCLQERNDLLKKENSIRKDLLKELGEEICVRDREKFNRIKEDYREQFGLDSLDEDRASGELQYWNEEIRDMTQQMEDFEGYENKRRRKYMDLHRKYRLLKNKENIDLTG